MSDDGKLTYFLGIKVDHKAGGLFLSQSSYAKEILLRANMQDCKPIATQWTSKQNSLRTMVTKLTILHYTEALQGLFSFSH